MLRTTFQAMCLLLLLFCGAAILLYNGVQRDEDAGGIREFLLPTEHCAAPCWLGIRPGITDSREAVDILRAVPWVTDIYAIQGIVTNDSFIRWGWSGGQPGAVDSERDGQMWFHNGLVYEIDIPLTTSFSGIWGAFGAPETVTALKAPLTPAQVFYRALYFDQTVEIRGSVACPLNPYNLLSTRMDAHIVVAAHAAYPAIERRPLCQRADH
jgi:hypothetical protein